VLKIFLLPPQLAHRQTFRTTDPKRFYTLIFILKSIYFLIGSFAASLRSQPEAPIKKHMDFGIIINVYKRLGNVWRRARCCGGNNSVQAKGRERFSFCLYRIISIAHTKQTESKNMAETKRIRIFLL